MLRLEIHEKTAWVGKIIGVTLAIVIPVVLGLGKFNPDQWAGSPVFRSAIVNCEAHGWWAVATLSVLSAAVQGIAAYLGAPVAWKTVQYILDEFREVVFASHGGTPADHHKVTLFRHTRWYWRRLFWSQWLVPVARCGDRQLSGIPSFRAPLNAPSKAQGIAGLAWQCKTPMAVPDLPDISATNVSKATLEDYSRKTGVSLRWLTWRRLFSRRRRNARSLMGYPIETKGQVRWVLVFDSQDPREISAKPLETSRRRGLLDALGKLLENT